MTIPVEEVRAVQQTRAWLLLLLNRRYRPGWRELRQMASWLVKHYPSPSRIAEAYRDAGYTEGGKR